MSLQPGRHEESRGVWNPGEGSILLTVVAGTRLRTLERPEDKRVGERLGLPEAGGRNGGNGGSSQGFGRRWAREHLD